VRGRRQAATGECRRPCVVTARGDTHEEVNTELNREQKGQVTAAVVERLTSADAVVAADFRGLTVAQLADLRGRLREAEAEMTVVKNTLSRRAANESGREGLLPYLEGPTGLVWINGDPARAAKALNDFAKEHTDVFTIRGGILGDEDLPTANIVRLASLPSREALLAQLAGGIAAPLTGLAGTLNSLISTLARTLAAVQGSGQLAPGEPPAVAEAEASSPTPETEAPAAPESEAASEEASPADATEAEPADGPGEDVASADDAPTIDPAAADGVENPDADASAADDAAAVEESAAAPAPEADSADASREDEVGDLFPEGQEFDPTESTDGETPQSHTDSND
jgi:large subunit ribosomal protein L10